MHNPPNVSLEEWIRELIATNKLYKFYKTQEWLTLRAEVMSDHHNECARCKDLGAWTREGGHLHRSDRYHLRRADTVHHTMEVRDYPSLALTRFVDRPGGRVEVLLPLCNTCHNEIHGRLFVGQKPKEQLNEERW